MLTRAPDVDSRLFVIVYSSFLASLMIISYARPVLLWLRVGLPFHSFLMAGFGGFLPHLCWANTLVCLQFKLSKLAININQNASDINGYICGQYIPLVSVLTQQTELSQSNTHMNYVFVVNKCQEQDAQRKFIFQNKWFYVACDVIRPSTWLREFLSSWI